MCNIAHIAHIARAILHILHANKLHDVTLSLVPDLLNLLVLILRVGC